LLSDIGVPVPEGPVFVEDEIIDHSEDKGHRCRNKQLDMQHINEKVKRTQINSSAKASHNRISEKNSPPFGHAVVFLPVSSLTNKIPEEKKKKRGKSDLAFSSSSME
jgi:hypothetical protein